MSFSIDRPLKQGLSDIELKPKEALKYVETDPEKRIQKQKMEFMTLLTTQLKNQDPFAPMDTNTMAQQMFAISGVEQQFETNKILGVIRDLINESHTSNAIGYMGKTGFFEGNTILLSDPKAKFPIRYEVAGEAENATIKIFDMGGNEVHSQTMLTREGKNGFLWDPQDKVPAGVYKYHIELNSKDKDTPAKVKTYGFGKINGITMDEGKNYFDVNGQQIPAERFSQLIDLDIGNTRESAPAPAPQQPNMVEGINTMLQEAAKALNTNAPVAPEQVVEAVAGNT